ncbi:MAG: class I SAM-dependent methyltransferase, partial [Bacteroidota bacterium]
MKKIIDNFSTQAQTYQKFRPVYPQAVYDLLFSLVKKREQAWDCGTGNGQVAKVLAEHFKMVRATDISDQQLKSAAQKSNIHYSNQRAESTNFPDQTFDLITVAQAIHWFDFAAFYQEVKRVLKPNSILAIFGYGLLRIEGINDQLDYFYKDLIGS